MRKILPFLFLFSLFVLGSCKNRGAYVEVEESPLRENNFSTLSEEPSIGEVHNYLLDIAHKNILSLRSTDGKIDMTDVLDLWFSSDYMKSQNVSDEDRDIVYNNVLWFVNKLKDENANSAEDVAMFFQSLVPTGNTRASYGGIDVYQDVFEHSMNYWSTYLGVNLRGSGNGVIIADAAGSLWGLWGGAVGSIVAGAAASLMANNPRAFMLVAEEYDWRCNPKYM